MALLDKIRTFVEIRLAEKTQKKILDMIVSMNSRFAAEEWKVRWVHPDNVHLTLRFLGDIDSPMVDLIRDHLMPLGQMTPFRMTVKGIGAFPSFGSPRIIWVGIEDSEKKLEVLAEKMEGALEKMGFKPETRKFRPHITIGRVARRGSKPLVDLVGDLGEEFFGEDEVREFVFMKSELTPQRAVHTPLWSIAFKHRRPEPAVEEKAELKVEEEPPKMAEEP
jgi:2'-5' RNA ligase